MAGADREPPLPSRILEDLGNYAAEREAHGLAPSKEQISWIQNHVALLCAEADAWAANEDETKGTE